MGKNWYRVRMLNIKKKGQIIKTVKLELQVKIMLFLLKIKSLKLFINKYFIANSLLKLGKY